jgi:hypothetical protein
MGLLEIKSIPRRYSEKEQPKHNLKTNNNMNYLRHALLLLAFLCLISPAGAYQAVLTADTYVNVTVATPPNEGAATSLVIAGSGGHSQDVGLVKYSFGTLPSGTSASQVSRAILTVYVDSLSFASGTTGTVYVYPVTQGNFSEASEPSISGSSNTGSYPLIVSGTSIASATIAAATSTSSGSLGNFVTFDITSQVQSWLTTPSSNFGLAIKIYSSDLTIGLDSKESTTTSQPATLEVDLAGAAGAAGATGPAGPAGPTGPAGANGTAGAQGAQGPAGSQGPAGANGAPGATGPAGPQGPAGSENGPEVALPSTTSSSSGLITLDGASFLHSYGSDNTFLGSSSGNFTLTGSGNTGEGYYTLNAETSGSNNVATGTLALAANTNASGNVATGYKTLTANITGDYNVGMGYLALEDNTSGSRNVALGTTALAASNGSNDTAIGNQALLSNTSGNNDTASGSQALSSNTTGTDNTASGYQALYSNTIDSEFYGGNVADGYQALYSNKSTGGDGDADLNTAVGYQALYSNTDGFINTAIGAQALYSNKTGQYNVAAGEGALTNNTTGSNNVAVGVNAGLNVTQSNNIDIGNAVINDNGTTSSDTSSDSGVIRLGAPGLQSTAYVAGIYGTTVTGVAVQVNSSGQLGVLSSSRRFKDNIKNMGQVSDVLLALHPVTYHYKPALDPSATPQFGLVAEDVAKIDPDLVVWGKDGKPYTVRYEAVNAMLLNEFLKEHQKVQSQEAKVESQETQLAAQQKELQSMESKLGEIESQVHTDHP